MVLLTVRLALPLLEALAYRALLKDLLHLALHSINRLLSEHPAAQVESVNHSDLNKLSDLCRDPLLLSHQEAHQDLKDLKVLLDHDTLNTLMLIFTDLKPLLEFMDLAALKDQDRSTIGTQELRDHLVHLDQTNPVVLANLS